VLRDAPHPEAVHQLRVAARRLRSALATFRPVVEDSRYQPVKDELRWLAKAFDNARNLDVFADEVLAPAQTMTAPPAGLGALVEAVEAARAGARKDACETAASERFRTLMIDATAWVETGEWLSGVAVQQPARAFATQTLDRRLKKLLKRGRKLETRDDAARHQVRIEAKKLRYAAEGFASLYPDKKVDRFVGRLKRLQDDLGALNDIATAEPLIASLDLNTEAAFAAGELEGLKLADKAKLVGHAAKALDRLDATEPFWG
jgi:CHAD domain-containing protein